MAAAMNAADIDEATPISDWHPPSAPESVALCLPRYPTAAPARRPARTFSFGSLRLLSTSA